jgi:hypothetical protein
VKILVKNMVILPGKKERTLLLDKRKAVYREPRPVRAIERWVENFVNWPEQPINDRKQQPEYDHENDERDSASKLNWAPFVHHPSASS